MTILRVGRTRLGLALLVASLAAAAALRVPARGQAQAVGNGGALAQVPANLPPPPPKGAWGEVIMANNRWLVVQNHQGQQFPIAADAVSQFLIRWPTTLNALTRGESVVEVVGPDLGSNSLQTDHVDVFEGADRALVAATATRILPNNRPDTAVDPGFNRFMNAFDVGSQNLLYGWAYPVNPGQEGIPARLHVVGPVLNINPLQIVTPGNNFATVASDGAMSVTQMTRGSCSFAEKGDLVYLMPTELTARTVVLSQLVLYKKIPLRQFRQP